MTGIFNISSSEITHLSKLFKYLEKKYKFKIKYYSKDLNEYLIISNKLLIKKIGIFNFKSIKKILSKVYNK